MEEDWRWEEWSVEKWEELLWREAAFMEEWSADMMQDCVSTAILVKLSSGFHC